MTELTGLPTPTINWESNNLPETWRKFQTTVKLMFRGPLRDNEENSSDISLSLYRRKGREIYNMWSDITPDERDRLSPHFERFSKDVQSRINSVFVRYKLRRT